MRDDMIAGAVGLAIVFVLAFVFLPSERTGQSRFGNWMRRRGYW